MHHFELFGRNTLRLMEEWKSRIAAQSPSKYPSSIRVVHSSYYPEKGFVLDESGEFLLSFYWDENKDLEELSGPEKKELRFSFGGSLDQILESVVNPGPISFSIGVGKLES